MKLLSNLLDRLYRCNRTSLPANRSSHAACRRLTLETLEVRQVMDGAFAPLITSMTELANLYPTKTTPTMLYLNFDGSASRGISALASASRGDDMQEILFRTSEIFAPFNVQVVRIYGDDMFSSTNGNTTIFIGNEWAKTGTRAYTPAKYSDYPSDNTSHNHRINSDPFDIAVVDPQDGSSSWNNLAIAQAIAHEAGHTFGLAHVLSSPDLEVMSYDAVNASFRNVTYSVTNLNNNGGLGVNVPNEAVQPIWFLSWSYGLPVEAFGIPVTYDIKLQNSYTTLSKLLGANASNRDSVANLSAVDPGFAAQQVNVPLAVGRTLTGNLHRQGDYDVFTHAAGNNGTLRVEVDNLNGSFVTPTIMIYDPTSDQMVEVASSANSGHLEVTFNAVANVSYRIIVGARDGISTGDYEISLDAGLAGSATTALQLPQMASNLLSSGNAVRIETLFGHFRLTVNNVLVWSDQLKDLTALTVVGTEWNDSFTLAGVLPFTLTISGGEGIDSVTGNDAANIWNVKTLNRGEITSSASPIEFTSIENLIGGSGPDLFLFRSIGKVSGFIRGGGGIDTLDYSALIITVAVNLTSGSATGTAGVSAIENITGGRNSDTLIGNSETNVIRGGAGGDTIHGRAGDDQLFGEDGLDWLYGEAGADTLDGGADDYVDNLYGDALGATDEIDTYISHYFAVAEFFARQAKDVTKFSLKGQR